MELKYMIAKDLVPENWHFEWIESFEDVKCLGAGTIRELIRHWRREAKNLVREFKKQESNKKLLNDKEFMDQRIRMLLALEKITPTDIPIFPQHRSTKHFSIGDEAVVFVGDWKAKLCDEEWLAATVVDGFRYQDGSVPVLTNIRVHGGPEMDGKLIIYGNDRPEVMKLSEFEYLRVHSLIARNWVRSVRGIREFSGSHMIEAFKRASLRGFSLK